MKSKYAVSASVLVVAALSLSLALYAGEAKFNKKVEVGQQAPTFAKLKGTDGKLHGLADYKDAQVLVVVFTCNGCPVAKAYEERLVAFTKSYADKKVALVAINSNASKDEKLAPMKARADEKQFNFPYVKDADQKIGKSYGATVTPHVFVLDKDRKIAYMGAFDDKMEVEKVTKHHVKQAVDALLAGKTPEVTESKQFGCGIDYE